MRPAGELPHGRSSGATLTTGGSARIGVAVDDDSMTSADFARLLVAAAVPGASALIVAFGFLAIVFGFLRDRARSAARRKERAADR